MKKLSLIIMMAVLFLSGRNAMAQNLRSLMQERGEYYFSIAINDLSDVQRLTKLCSVDQFDGNSVICYANENEYQHLLKAGYQMSLMTPPSLLEKVEMWDGSNRAAYDWDQYPTYQAYETMMQDFATEHPERCTYMELGTLASGRKIMFCRINNGQTEGKPRFLYTSTMHGDEVTGMMLMLRLIDELCTSNDDRILNLVNNLDIFICPDANPDGTYHGGNNSMNGATRENSHGIDLNRSFPDFVDGPHPNGASSYEDEATWMMELAEEYLFTMGANYHGGSEVMNFPWDNYRPHCADDEWWQMVCHEYADLTHLVNSNYMSDFDNGITRGCDWYMIGGGRQDYMNYYQQCREVCIECSNSKMPNASQMPNFWNYNHNSMLAYMEQCLNGIHGTVTDAATGEALQGVTVTIENHDHHNSFVTTHEAGDYHRPILAGTYNVTYACSGYYPQTISVTVVNGEAVIQDVQLEAGEGIIPDFNASATAVAIGGSVNFTDASWGAHLTNWSWTFEGGQPTTSNEQNPTVVYNATGSFDVTLSVTNSDGQTETITKTDYITVSEQYNMSNTTISTCSAIFYDDGGANNNYGSNKDYTMTFLPSGPGRSIQVEFLSFNTESGYDKLYIYDGSNTSSQPIGTYSGSDSPGTVTATNAEGALTFRFQSDYSLTYAGWEAAIRCVYANPLAIEVTADPDIINEGESSQLHVIATGGAEDYTYSWEPAESLNDPTIANPVATPALPTEYTVTVTDGDGNSISASIFVDIRDLNVEDNELQTIKVYPNPSNGQIYIKGVGNQVHYTLVNSLGQAIAHGETNHDMMLSQSLAQGIYMLYLSNERETEVIKIVVE